MTTKLQQRSIDLLTRAPHSYYFAVNPLSINYQYYSELEFCTHELEFSMNRMLELQTIESMRKMMLIQEEIFKQQVQDLHRLYNLQKKLMQELENGLMKQPKAKTAQTDTNIINSMFSVWHQTATKTGHSNFQALIARDDLKEVSGSCSGDNSSRMPINLGLSTPAESTSNIHLSEDHKDLKRIDEENDVEVELTLCIGHCTKNKRLKNEYDQSNQVHELGSSSRKTSDGDGEPSSSINDNPSTVCQENMRPHWLLQDLSLSRT